jgi:DNA-binding GntR family transcriptional regulator
MIAAMAAEPTPIAEADGAAKPGSVVDRVARMLRTAILTGEIKPGERIRQEAVAATCQTSRIPVREALRGLAMEGLVTLEPNVGARVADMDLSELEEVFLIRERLEPLAITLSVPKLSDVDIDELRRLVASMETSFAEEDTSTWLVTSRQFHMTAYRACGLPKLLALIAGLWDTLDRYRRIYFAGASNQERVDITQAEHRLVFEALKRRDAESAAQLVEMHIRRTRQMLLGRP